MNSASSTEWASKTTQLGQAWIELRVPTRLPWNDTLQGVCMIQALDADVSLPRLDLEIDVWNEDEAPHKVSVEPARWRDQQIARGKRLDLKFDATLPGGQQGRAGRVALLVRGPGFWNRAWLEIQFTLTPPRLLAVFMDGVQDLTGLPSLIWTRPEQLYDAAVQLRGRSGPHPELLKVDIEVYEAAGWLRGHLDVVGRVDYLDGGAPGIEQRRFEIAFEAYDLDAGLNQVAAHLRSFTRVSRTLPIPIENSTAAGTGQLPIPTEPRALRIDQLPKPEDVEPA